MLSVAAQGTVVVAVTPRTVNSDFSKDNDKPKTNPAEVATAALQAVIDQLENVCLNQEAQQTIAQLNTNRKPREKQLTQILLTPAK